MGDRSTLFVRSLKLVEMVFRQYPAKVERTKVKELGIEKICIEGDKESINETAKILALDDERLHVLADAMFIGRDVVWGQNEASFGTEDLTDIYQLWLLRKI
jgi:hypothetical protein